jgi:hypothetical protein
VIADREEMNVRELSQPFIEPAKLELEAFERQMLKPAVQQDGFYKGVLVPARKIPVGPEALRENGLFPDLIN